MTGRRASTPRGPLRDWFRPRSDILGRAFVVIVAVRLVLAAHAVLSNLFSVLPRATNVIGIVAVCLVILGWTVLVSWRLRDPRERTNWMLVADLGVTVSVMVVTPLVVPLALAPITLAGYWLAGPALYAAVLLSTRAAMVAAAVTSLVYLGLFPTFHYQRFDVALVLLLATATLGELMSQFRATISEQERERTRSVALAERERLSRIVHDGALQVLALVEREAPSLGPRGMRLAALARESESQLRTLLRDREIVDDNQTTLVDLAGALDKYQSARVTVSTMAGQVMVPRPVVDEVEATLAEALANVEKHAGEDAEAWVLLDQETDDEVILWVRDNGIGVSADQVTEAAARGRMGIKDSIVGRMAAIGGSAMLKSTPSVGTEWELRFPVDGVE